MTNDQQQKASASGERSGRSTERGLAMSWALTVGVGVILAGTIAASTWPSSQPGAEATVVVPPGATFGEVVDSLESSEVVRHPLVLRAVARWRGADRRIKAGTYQIQRGIPTGRLLDVLVRGEVVTYPITVPEGLTLEGIAARIAGAVGADSASVADSLRAVGRWNAPGSGTTTRPGPEAVLGAGNRSNPGRQGGADRGPALEGYLFPDTYRFAEGVSIEAVVDAMLDRYRRYWSSERIQRLAELDMSENELVTLASIVQAEARMIDEMPRIASVYHNRLRIGMPLQADPTVFYALGGHRARLLYAAMDSVAEHPYNTYTRAGLPPGPISAPGADALDAALWPEDTGYLYFVARPNGSHIFTTSLREHNNARIRVRREAAASS